MATKIRSLREIIILEENLLITMVVFRPNLISDGLMRKLLKFKIAFVFVAITFFTSSCNHYYYAPNSNFTPLMTEKNEVSLNVHGSLGWEHGGGEFQGAYALGEHLGVMASIFSASGEEGTTDSEDSRYYKEEKDSGEGTYYEAGLGYFTALNKGNKFRKGVFEVYGGIGRGNVFNSFGEYRSVENSFTKVFVQPSLGYKSRAFDIAFSGKLSMVNVNLNRNSTDQKIDKSDLDNISFVEGHPGSLVWEPGFMAQLGWSPIKLKMQLTRSFNLTYPEYPQDNFVFAIGVNARFNVKKQKPAGGK
ncbi:hypothetical protein [Desertivirga brevis]|uniref:hypothetical protein n=1 Tax=Desertivirga brevis TaxID=2810310 RepID=UPI001A96BFDF|nr:hypothetical protein [Pedobacter sp. SYSU D00873]